MAPTPRPDQIAELTRGVRLPLQAIAWPLLGVVVDAVRDAWRHLIDIHGANLHGKTEPELTALLQSRLNHLRVLNRRLGQIISGVARGVESISFDGKHIEKRPDLSLFLTARNANFPLVVECKIIDHSSGKGIDLYCAQGLRRFIDGEYSWASSQAFMIGYVRDQSSIESSLTPHLKITHGSDTDPFMTTKLPLYEAAETQTMSEHNRNFRYLNAQASDTPGPITISHVWMDVPV